MNLYKVPKELIKKAREIIEIRENNKEISRELQKNVAFAEYFTKDPFFLEINSMDWTEMPMECDFNNVVAKNVAIATTKTGKSRKEIEVIIKPFIAKIKGYHYKEFLGWLQKAESGEFDVYNIIEINEWAEKYLGKEFYEVLEYTSESSVQDNEKRPEDFTSLNDLLKKDFPEPNYWLKPLIPKGTINLWGGKPASAKSLLALAVTLHLVANKDFLEFKVENIPKILFYDLENGEVLFYRRCKYIMKGNKLSIKNAKFDVSFKFNKNNLDEEIKKCKDYDIIILDSYRRFLKGDESDSKNSDKFYQNFLHKLKSLGKTVIIIHHFRKIKLEDLSEGEVLDAFRGSSDIGANIDNAFGFFKTSSIYSIGDRENFTVKVVKAKVRDTYPIQDFGINIERDGNELSTKFIFEGWGKHKEIEKPKDRAKRLIMEFLRIEEKGRKDIVDMMKKEMDYTPGNVDILLKELVSDGKIKTLKHGVYSMVHTQNLKIEDFKNDERKTSKL